MVLLACSAVSGQAAAGAPLRGPTAKVTAAFDPLAFGTSAAVSFALRLDSPPGTAPTPLAGIEVRYPRNLGLATSGLGLASCDPSRLEVFGETVCPADSRMGSGSAVAVLQFGSGLVRERVTLGVFAAASTDGYLHLAVLAHGREPVAASIVLQGVLLPGLLRIKVPAIAGLPGSPYVSIVSMTTKLGGDLTYYERVGSKMRAYRPRGIGLPESCPHGGWPVSVAVSFRSGARSAARTLVRCPSFPATVSAVCPGRGASGCAYRSSICPVAFSG